MGANAQTAVPVFTAGQVLTAQQQTEINTGIPVFATTVTRDAAFGGTGEKTLAEGQFAYIEASNSTQYYDGAAWQAVGASGLVLVKSQTIGTTVSSVAVTDAFSATYDNYLITVNGGISSANGVLRFIFTGSTTGYYSTRMGIVYSSAAVSNGADNNAASFTVAGTSRTDGLYAAINLTNPFLAKSTYGTFSYGSQDADSGVLGFLNHQVATSFSGFTFTPSTGTVTGGTIRVYGYATSQDYMTYKIQIDDLVRNATPQEAAQIEAAQAEGEAQAEAAKVKLAERQNVLDKLGLTDDEAAALFG